ncbi:formyltransferase family protein [Pseudofrankia asymbiotica]|uniref:formyltransferase family protein n=1 Tax=Pseudofrankia asymbiotica TaxID=1834516 RepID=UPI0009D6F1C5|nr:formyltransferase family protein [Pseudofrankia asymbiotica]
MRIVIVSANRYGVALHKTLKTRTANPTVEIGAIVGPNRRIDDQIVNYFTEAQRDGDLGLGLRTSPGGNLLRESDYLEASIPDVIVAAGWRWMIDVNQVSAKLAQLRPDGAPTFLGTHPSPLPYGRGQSPISWTFLEGASSTALCLFELTTEPDAGSVLWSEKIRIDQTWTCRDLYFACIKAHENLGAWLGEQEDLADLTLPETFRLDRGPRRRLGASDAQIRGISSADYNQRVFRAFDYPYGPVWIEIGGTLREVRSLTVLSDLSRGEPGMIVQQSEKCLLLHCNPGLVEVQIE